jgi:hypothetical protein
VDTARKCNTLSWEGEHIILGAINKPLRFEAKLQFKPGTAGHTLYTEAKYAKRGIPTASEIYNTVETVEGSLWKVAPKTSYLNFLIFFSDAAYFGYFITFFGKEFAKPIKIEEGQSSESAIALGKDSGNFYIVSW